MCQESYIWMLHLQGAVSLKEGLWGIEGGGGGGVLIRECGRMQRMQTFHQDARLILTSSEHKAYLLSTQLCGSYFIQH